MKKWPTFIYEWRLKVVWTFIRAPFSILLSQVLEKMTWTYPCTTKLVKFFMHFQRELTFKESNARTPQELAELRWTAWSRLYTTSPIPTVCNKLLNRRLLVRKKRKPSGTADARTDNYRQPLHNTVRTLLVKIMEVRSLCDRDLGRIHFSKHRIQLTETSWDQFNQPYTKQHQRKDTSP